MINKRLEVKKMGVESPSIKNNDCITTIMEVFRPP